MFEVIKDRIKLSIPVMAFVGFTFMIGAVFQWVSFLKKPVDLYSVDYANLRWHDHITADMDFVFSTGLSDGEGGAKRNFYLIPMIEEDGEGGAYMTKVLFYEELAIDSSRTDNIAENVEKLWRGESGALKLGLYSKPFDGFLRKMNKKEKPVFRLYLKKMGYSDSEIDDVLCPYVLTDAKTEGIGRRFCIGLVCFLVGGTITAVWFLFKKKQAREEETLNVYSGVVETDEEMQDTYFRG